MKIVIHDYSGHPFHGQLSRELASRGHHVCHLFYSEFQTPKGKLSISAKDPASLDIRSVQLGEVFAKDNFIVRRAQEKRVGRLLSAAILDTHPDVVLSSNAPLDVQWQIMKA